MKHTESPIVDCVKPANCHQSLANLSKVACVIPAIQCVALLQRLDKRLWNRLERHQKCRASERCSNPAAALGLMKCAWSVMGSNCFFWPFFRHSCSVLQCSSSFSDMVDGAQKREEQAEKILQFSRFTQFSSNFSFSFLASSSLPHSTLLFELCRKSKICQKKRPWQVLNSTANSKEKYQSSGSPPTPENCKQKKKHSGVLKKQVSSSTTQKKPAVTRF